MAWRIYKEGQGKWLRGAMAGVFFIAAVAAAFSIHNQMRPWWFKIPALNWSIDVRTLIEAPILVMILAYGVYLYNKPKVVDFLIDTEHELKNRVTWPGKKEELNASLVVVVTVIIMMFYIFVLDSSFSWLKSKVYGS